MLGIELCAGLPATSHRYRGQIRGFPGPITLFVRGIVGLTSEETHLNVLQFTKNPFLANGQPPVLGYEGDAFSRRVGASRRSPVCKRSVLRSRSSSGMVP